MSTIHIESNKEDISDVVLMPGDPKRSEFIAKKYLKDYKIVNNVRNMTAYTGYYKDRLITIFPSGMGCPSMGIYSYELYNNYNVKNIIRIGSCGGYSEKLHLRDVILVESSCSESNYGHELCNDNNKEVRSSEYLNKVINSVAVQNNKNLVFGKIYCSDSFYEEFLDYRVRRDEKNVLGVEMETFALFQNAKKLNRNASALLTVTDLFFSDDRLSSKAREQELDEMIKIALESCLKL